MKKLKCTICKKNNRASKDNAACIDCTVKAFSKLGYNRFVIGKY